jgi:PhnB protein
MNRFQPDGWHTVTPRIITSEAEELVRFVKEVFHGQGEFQLNRPAEIRIGDSLLMISNGDGLRERVSAFLYVYVEDVMRHTGEQSKREENRLSSRQTFRTGTGGQW